MGNCIPKKKKGKDEEAPTEGTNEGGSLDADAVTVGFLSVTVIRAKLETGKTPSVYDPYVIVEVTGASTNTKRETVRRERTSTPIWGHRLEGIPVGKADLLAIRFYVHSDEKFIKDPFLGYAEVALPIHELVELLVSKRNLTLPLVGRPGVVQDQAFLRKHNDRLGELIVSLRTCLPDLPTGSSGDISNVLTMVGLDDQIQYQSMDVMVAGANLKPEYEEKYTIEIAATEGVAHGASLPRQTDPKQGPNLQWRDGGEPIFTWLLHSIMGTAQQLNLQAAVTRKRESTAIDANASMILQEELLQVMVKLTPEDLYKSLARPLKKKLILQPALSETDQTTTVVEKDDEVVQQLFLIFRSSAIVTSQVEEIDDAIDESRSTVATDPINGEATSQLQRTQRINTLIGEIESNIDTTETDAKIQGQLSNFLFSVGDKNPNHSAARLLKESHDLEDYLYNQLQERYPNRTDDLDFLKQFYMVKQGILKRPLPEGQKLPDGHGPLDPSLIIDDPVLSTEERLRRAMLREQQRSEFIEIPSRRTSLLEQLSEPSDKIVHRDPNFVARADEMSLLPPPPSNPLKTLPSLPNSDPPMAQSPDNLDENFIIHTRSEESRISALEKELRYMKRTVQKSTDLGKRFDEYAPVSKDQTIGYESRSGFIYQLGKQTNSTALSPESSFSLPVGPVPKKRSEMLSTGLVSHHNEIPHHAVSEYELHSWMSVMPNAGIEVVVPPNRLSPKPKRWRKGAPISPTANPTGWRPMSPAKISSTKRPWK